jgi:catechol 2,3-dioxygenase-like lactoylglutathione lyase family enzyme
MRRPWALAAVLAATLSTAMPSAQPAATAAGLDHVNVAVANLDRAAERYRQLGFVLKPGTVHSNGIQNVHAKFRDGTEIELITAPEARDALTTKYRDLLRAGDGPAFLALYTPVADLTSSRGAVPPPYIFFGGRNHSPTDRPEHFAHPNSAESLISVWLAGDDFRVERRLLQSLGAKFTDSNVYVPDRQRATVASLRDGTVVLLPQSRQAIPDRRIAGVTVRVASMASVEAALIRGGIATPSRITHGDTVSIFLPPAETHGIWMEFRGNER